MNIILTFVKKNRCHVLRVSIDLYDTVFIMKKYIKKKQTNLIPPDNLQADFSNYFSCDLRSWSVFYFSGSVSKLSADVGVRHLIFPCSYLISQITASTSETHTPVHMGDYWM